MRAGRHAAGSRPVCYDDFIFPFMVVLFDQSIEAGTDIWGKIVDWDDAVFFSSLPFLTMKDS